MSVAEGEYDRLEDPRYVHGPISLLVLSILLDRVVTVLFWYLEANPLVVRMGLGKWLLLTIILIAGSLYAWYPAMGVRNDIVRSLVYGTAIYHLAAVILNIAVVF